MNFQNSNLSAHILRMRRLFAQEKNAPTAGLHNQGLAIMATTESAEVTL